MLIIVLQKNQVNLTKRAYVLAFRFSVWLSNSRGVFRVEFGSARVIIVVRILILLSVSLVGKGH